MRWTLSTAWNARARGWGGGLRGASPRGGVACSKVGGTENAFIIKEHGYYLSSFYPCNRPRPREMCRYALGQEGKWNKMGHESQSHSWWFPPWKNPKLEVSKAFHNPVHKLARYIALFSNMHYACQHRVIVWLYPACWKANRWYCKVFRLWQVFRLFVKKTPTWLVS